eukprot:CAMPEP_0175082518 /NCGR_PEP_ID=MMETSP0052_2-20121109/26806_1 /TAXON_ID=51329 ORGANISM="Polytomella parva, Strain SAG 63-3" /NCGR_SAMPLE_ID=MMETSP0052_2 /ASSEMBLY_ACC=CAM_ASM_000194 /LENGTH=216 /DNA_ID=CAMNT_0016353735 /DNA_START=27 /DNA_END=675 /DNA_ORIENTATION=+
MAQDGPPTKRIRMSNDSLKQFLNKPKRQSSHQYSNRTNSYTLTVKELATDKLNTAFSDDLVKRLYLEELNGGSSTPPILKRVMILEFSQYLERYLWPNFSATSSHEHVMSIILMANEKFRENSPAWTSFHSRPDMIPVFFEAIFSLLARRASLRLHERLAHLVFLINAFQSLEDDLVRPQVLRLVSLPLWAALSPGRLQLEMHHHPDWARRWRHAL